MYNELMVKKILKYTAVFEVANEGGYIVSVPALPGCYSQGETREEAEIMIKDAIKSYLAVLKKENQPIPHDTVQPFTKQIAIESYSFS